MIENLNFNTFGRPPVPHFSPQEILSTLDDWTGDNPFGFTGLDYLDRGESYCWGIHNSDAYGFLLCLWHRTPTVDGNALYAARDGSVGEVAVQATPIPEDTIPGIPAYYWFPPRSRYVCGVAFKDRPASRNKLCDYIKAFMTYRCSLVNRTTDLGENSAEVTSLLLPDGTSVRASVKISTGTMTDSGDLPKRLGEIRAIERKEEFNSPPLRSAIDRISDFFGYESDTAPRTQRVHYTIDLPEGVSEDEFEQIKEHYQEHAVSENRVIDYGFHLQGGRVQWLSERKLVSDHHFDVVEKNSMVQDLEALARQLTAQQDAILSGRISTDT